MLLTPRGHAWGREARLFAVVVVIAAGAPCALAQSAPAGLTLAEVLDLHRSGVSDQQIVRAAHSYCLSFVVSDSVARTLSTAGVGTTLLDSLRATCAATPQRPPLPPGVLLDDDLATTSGIVAFVAPDGLCRATVERAGLRIANQRKRAGCVIGYPSDSVSGAIRIELTVGPLLGADDPQVVLGFGRSADRWNQYTFSVTLTGHVELCRSSSTDCRTLTSRVSRGVVNIGPEVDNVLAVELRPGSIALFVNDEHVGDYLPDGAVRGGIVVGVGPASSVVFRRLRVRTLDATASR